MNPEHSLLQTPLAQAEIITAIRNEPFAWDLVIACPGSGKSFTLVERIKHLATLHDPTKFVVITFTNAAANSLRERLGSFAGPRIGFIGTLHSWILSIIPGWDSIQVIDEQERDERLEEILTDGGYGKLKKSEIWRIHREIVETGNFDNRSAAGLAAKEYFLTTVGRNVIDFDTILYLGLKHLKTDRLREELGKEIEWIFVDEFQDTAKIDYEIYRQLRQFIPFHFYVGDSDQSIYGWRGADHTGIIQIANEVSGFKVSSLLTNYRCSSAVCEAAQHLIEHNVTRIKKAMNPAPSTPSGEVTVAEYQTIGEEVKSMTERIFANISAEPLQSHAVLLRTNALVDVYSGMLESWNIPVVKSQPPLESSPDIRKAVKAILMLSNPESDDFQRSWLTAKVDKDHAKAITHTAKRQFKSINAITGKREALDIGSRLWNELYSLEIPPHIVVRLQAIAAQLREGSSVSDLLLAVREEQMEKSPPIDKGVSVITMHSAKGLEWDVVFLPAFEQHTIPGKKTGDQLEEERRVAFVALTRARVDVHISTVVRRKNSWRDWEMIQAIPSQFIDEMEAPWAL